MIVDKIETYGVVLRRLTQDKIEMVRNWRNDLKIQQYMFLNDYITPEMQQAWFARTDNDQNHYFIMEYDGVEVGLINLKDVDYEAKRAEWGYFIYEDKYQNSMLVFQGAFAIFDFAFFTLGLETIDASIRKTNKRALRMNNALGGVAVRETIRNSEEMFAYEIYKSKYVNNETIETYKELLSREA